MTTKLTPDAPVPALALPQLGGGSWDLAAQTPENFTMVVFYRGHHCPVCKGYLGKLDALVGAYEEAGFSVVAVSMNTEDLAQKSKDEWELKNLTLAYGLTEAAARAWGLWLSSSIKEAEADLFCEPGVFWVRPDGRLYLADISNMPWSRPDLEFLLSKVGFALENGYPARGTY